MWNPARGAKEIDEGKQGQQQERGDEDRLARAAQENKSFTAPAAQPPTPALAELSGAWATCSFS